MKFPALIFSYDNPCREIVVQFNADVADGMQWKFIPTQREVFLVQYVYLLLL